jgi:DNA polymerase-3 subunit epsilon
MNMAYPPSARQQAIQNANQVLQAAPVFLDTETTGLERTDEIIEISVVDLAGQTLFNKFVRPSKPIPASATQIHGITNDMVQGAQTWPILWMSLRAFLVGKVIVAYNSDFDQRMMQQSHERYRLPWRENLQMFDLLKLYSQYRGEWDSQRRSWKYFSLEEAGRSANLSLPNSHRALADTLLARALLIYIAENTA